MEIQFNPNNYMTGDEFLQASYKTIEKEAKRIRETRKILEKSNNLVYA